MWKSYRSTDKRYAGDNRLMFFESPYRRDRLAPRCRLIASWSWKRFQGLGCSPIKAVRELGLERRETVRILSTINVRKLKKADLSTRGPGRGNLWCRDCLLKSNRHVATFHRKNCWKQIKREIDSKTNFLFKVEDSHLFKIDIMCSYWKIVS